MSSDERELREALERTQAALREEREAARRLGQTSAELEKRLQEASQSQRELEAELEAARQRASAERQGGVEEELAQSLLDRRALHQSLEETNAKLIAATAPELELGWGYYSALSGIVLLGLCGAALAKGAALEDLLWFGVAGGVLVLAPILNRVRQGWRR